MRQLGIDDNKDLMRRLHDEIQKSKYEYSEKLKDLLKKLKDIMNNWRRIGKL